MSGGLGISIQTALSGLKTSQESISIASNNLANAMTPGYYKQSVNQQPIVVQGVGRGSYIKSIERNVDQYLLTNLRTQQSRVAKADTINRYLGEVQVLMGKPNSESSLDVKMNSFFNSIRNLQNSPETRALKQNVVQRGNALAGQIKSLAGDLQNMRYRLDQEFKDASERVNTLIKNLHDTNKSILKFRASGSVSPSILQQRDEIILELAKEADIQVGFNENETAFINVAGGKSLLDESRYELSYMPANSIQNFINDTEVGQVLIKRVNDSTGEHVGDSLELVSSGLETTQTSTSPITTELEFGRLKGLLDLRDTEIPNILAQLDNYAYKLSNEFNKIHNDGGGMPASKGLLGTKNIDSTQRRDFSGKVRIGLVDNNGKPVLRGNEQKLNPLTLDLSSLDSGSGAGQPTVQTIIDELNEYFYFAPTENSVSLGPLRDIRIAATADIATAPNGTFSFDFELDNDGDASAQFIVDGITVTDGGTTGLTTALPGDFTVLSGSRIRTGETNTVNFAGGGGGPYTIQANVRVIDDDGQTYASTISYVIDDNPTDTAVMNDRYEASSATQDGELVAPGTTQKFALAELVDENGDTVASGEGGYLNLRLIDDNGYHIVIDELSSQELGLEEIPGVQTGYEATNRGFSHFFQLNNFFQEYEQQRGNAINFELRSDIKADPQLMTVANLSKSAEKQEEIIAGKDQARGRVVFNSNPQVGDTLVIGGVTFNFVAAAAADNQVTIGANLIDTVSNLVAKLNATNATTAGTVDLATYNSFASPYGSSGVDIVYDTPGIIGNSFTISGNFATTGVEINSDGVYSTTPTGQLQNGSDQLQKVLRQQNTYEMGHGANNTLKKMTTLENIVFEFAAAGSIGGASATLTSYISDVISFSASVKIFYESELVKEEIFYNSFENKVLAGSGVKIDEEFADIMNFQQAYKASAKIISVVDELFDTLFASI